MKEIFMKKNLGTTDRIVRIIIAAAVSILYFTHIISGTLGIVLLAVAAILLLTSLISFCPLYRMLGLQSSATKKGTVN